MKDNSQRVPSKLIKYYISEYILSNDIKSIEICNTDNTEHLLSCCVRAEFKIKDLGVVFANENNGQFSILKDFVIYTTKLALIELNRVIQPKFPIINLLKLDAENLCSHYRFGLKE